MRIAAALVATFALSTSIATPVAHACGGDYGPRAPAMYLVAHHHARTFVLLDKDVVTDRLAWEGERESYDWTEIAPSTAFSTPRKLTLVGPDRSRRLATANHVFIKPVFETRDAMNALEIYPKANDQARIAIAGQFATVTWNEIESESVSLETMTWAQHPGFTPALDPARLSLSKVVGTNLELITAWTYGTDGKAVSSTYVRSPGAQPYGGYRGSPLGVVTLDGVRYMVLVTDGIVSPIRI